MSSIPSAKTIHELVHIVGTTDDLAQIVPMFRNSNGAVNVVGCRRDKIIDFKRFDYSSHLRNESSSVHVWNQIVPMIDGVLGTTFHVLSSLLVLFCFTSVEHAVTTHVSNLIVNCSLQNYWFELHHGDGMPFLFLACRVSKKRLCLTKNF